MEGDGNRGVVMFKRVDDEIGGDVKKKRIPAALNFFLPDDASQ